MSVIELKNAFTAYKTLADRRAALEAEAEELASEMAEHVATMKANLPEGTTEFKADGKSLIPVVGGGKGGNSNFLRGFAPKKTKTSKVAEVLDLDSDA